MTKFQALLAEALSLSLRNTDTHEEDALEIIDFFKEHGWSPPEGDYRIVEVESVPLGYEVEDKRQAGDPLVAAFTTRREAEAWVTRMEES